MFWCYTTQLSNFKTKMAISSNFCGFLKKHQLYLIVKIWKFDWQDHIKISHTYLQIWLFSFLGQVWTCSKIMEEAEIHKKKWPANKMTQAHTVDHPISHLSSLSNAPMLRTRVGLGQYHTSVMVQISIKFVKQKSWSIRLGDAWKT